MSLLPCPAWSGVVGGSSACSSREAKGVLQARQAGRHGLALGRDGSALLPRTAAGARTTSSLQQSVRLPCQCCVLQLLYLCR